jgi:L-asparaginase
MSGSAGGVVARLRGHELVDALAGLVEGVEIDVHDVQAGPSADLTFEVVLDVVAAAHAAVSAGASGVVVTQGTDTLEESAYLADLTWTENAPLVVTGAMRNPTLPGADGPANLVAALRVAAASSSRGRGALVVFADEIHAARLVRKSHSTSAATFISPDLGPLGHLVEGVPRFLGQVARPEPVAGFSMETLATTRIALYTTTLDDDGRLLERIEASHLGLVVAGYGVGHVPGRLAPRLGDLARVMPVVLTSRTGAGPVLSATYGAAGSERDLCERGLINGGFLHPYKARVLLRLLIASGASREQIVEAFAAYA